MAKPVSLILLTLLMTLVCILYFSGSLSATLEWLEILRLGFALQLMVVYLFMYWIVIEAKNSYLEWKYLEDR